MINEFEILAEEIKRNAHGKKIIYIPNPGNYGDGLIRYATKKFFKDFNIEHWEVNIGYGLIKLKLLPYLVEKSKYFFICGGGGGWCSAYNCGYRIARAISLFTNDLLVLPSTYDIDVSKINGTLFRRDKFKSLDMASGSLFCHDMAFYLTCVKEIDVYRSKSTKPKIGLLMRTDREAAIQRLSMPEANIDLSLLGDHMSNGDDFLLEVAKYTDIHTDRLHVCIAGLIVGARVNLYPGNYFKIKAIYSSSIEGIFENITMNESCDDLATLAKSLERVA